MFYSSSLALIIIVGLSRFGSLITNKIFYSQLLLLVAITSLFSSHVFAQGDGVRALIGKSSVKIDGERYWQTRVSCIGTKQKPRIISKTVGDSGEWCGREAPGFCRPERMQAAITVCSEEYKVAVARRGNEDQEQQDKQRSELKAKLIAEQMEIKRQQLNLDRRKLDLQRRELELQRAEDSLQQRMSGGQ